MAFCSKCGTQLSDGAKFCPKCGNPTVGTQGNGSSSSNSSNCSIELISAGAAKLVVVKALVDELGLGINDAKTLVDSTPCVLADGLSLSRAKELAQLLSKTGSKIAVNQNGKTIFVEEPSIEEESQTEEQNWGKYLKYAGYAFIALCLLYLFGVFDNDSSNNKGEKAQTEQAEQKEQKQEARKEESVCGTYEITDKVGCTIHLTLNEDETATITGVRGEDVTFYCKWYDYSSSGTGILIVSSEGRPNLVFDGGMYEGYYKDMALKDGWFYSGKEKAEANNPKWRLKATKIK